MTTWCGKRPRLVDGCHRWTGELQNDGSQGGARGYGLAYERPVQGILASRLVSIQGRRAGSAGKRAQVHALLGNRGPGISQGGRDYRDQSGLSSGSQSRQSSWFSRGVGTLGLLGTLGEGLRGCSRIGEVEGGLIPPPLCVALLTLDSVLASPRLGSRLPSPPLASCCFFGV